MVSSGKCLSAHFAEVMSVMSWLPVVWWQRGNLRPERPSVLGTVVGTEDGEGQGAVLGRSGLARLGKDVLQGALEV